jgi:hypothetical protein
LVLSASPRINVRKGRCGIVIFACFGLGLLASITVTQMQLSAIDWQVYLLTKSPQALGGHFRPLDLSPAFAG